MFLFFLSLNCPTYNSAIEGSCSILTTLNTLVFHPSLCFRAHSSPMLQVCPVNKSGGGRQCDNVVHGIQSYHGVSTVHCLHLQADVCFER